MNPFKFGMIGCQKGVPMGGDLMSAPSGASPSFLVVALKDPIGGNLDRIQIIKGWMEGEELKGQVYSDRRESAGSTRVARHAGSRAAAKATTPRKAVAPTKVSGSSDSTPNSIPLMTRVVAAAPARPRARPARVSFVP